MYSSFIDKAGLITYILVGVLGDQGISRDLMILGVG
jgi:hypothetical protein